MIRLQFQLTGTRILGIIIQDGHPFQVVDLPSKGNLLNLFGLAYYRGVWCNLALTDNADEDQDNR